MMQEEVNPDLTQQLLKLFEGRPIPELLLALMKVEVIALMQIPSYEARMKAFRMLHAAVRRSIEVISPDKPDKKRK